MIGIVAWYFSVDAAVSDVGELKTEMRSVKLALNTEITRSTGEDKSVQASLDANFDNLNKQVENLTHRVDAIYNMLVTLNEN